MPGVVIRLKSVSLLALCLAACLSAGSAVEALGQVGNNQQETLSTRLKVVDLLIKDGSLLPARSEVENLLGRYPDDTDVALSAARLYVKMGLSAFAIMQYEKVRHVRPLLVEPLVALSKLHLENLSTELAVRLANEAIAMEPDSRDAQLALVTALLAGQSVKQAQKQALVLERRYPNDPQVEHVLANVAQAFGENKKALALMRSACDARPAEQSWWLELAELYSANQDYEKAKEVLKGVLSRDSQSLKALDRLAHLNEFALHDYMAARANYGQIKQLLPDSTSAQAGMDRCLMKQGDLALNLRNFVRRLFHLQASDLKDESGASDVPAPDSF